MRGGAIFKQLFRLFLSFSLLSTFLFNEDNFLFAENFYFCSILSFSLFHRSAPGKSKHKPSLSNIPTHLSVYTFISVYMAYLLHARYECSVVNLPTRGKTEKSHEFSHKWFKHNYCCNWTRHICLMVLLPLYRNIHLPRYVLHPTYYRAIIVPTKAISVLTYIEYRTSNIFIPHFVSLPVVSFPVPTFSIYFTHPLIYLL